MRFRRSIKLAPGFRLNLSGSGLSASVGPRGASMTFGRRGAFFNAGIPGTGLSSRQRLGSSRSTSRAPEPENKLRISATVVVTDDGEVEYRDADGSALPEFWVTKAKRQNGAAIRDMLEAACAKINAAGRAAADIHLDTPDPNAPPTYTIAKFEEPEPTPPRAKPHGFLGWLFKSVARRIDEENARAARAFEQRKAAWTSEKEKFLADERRRKRMIEEDILHDTGAMAAWLEELLQSLEWPRETNVDFEIREEGAKVMLDVDLPEIEDMPRRSASLPAKGYKITMKDISAIQIQKQYMAHVHGLGFRIIGEVFAALPAVRRVVLSAYSQRPDKASGVVTDEYLYSVRVDREVWQRIEFNNLAVVDVAQALGRFELRRDMTKAGAFRPIEPFTN
jgi:hypothetical protein